MPKSGLSTAIIFKSSVVGPGVPTGTPGVCWATTREVDCCSAGLLPDSAAVGQISAQRATAATANRAKTTTAKRRYVFISILLANNAKHPRAKNFPVGQILALFGATQQCLNPVTSHEDQGVFCRVPCLAYHFGPCLLITKTACCCFSPI